MRLFSCPTCARALYFENTACEACGTMVLFDPAALHMVAEGIPCANAGTGGCNWAVTDPGHGPFCDACRYNRTIPDLSVAGNDVLWRRVETAKRRAIYGLLRFGIAPPDRSRDPDHGLAFDILADADPAAQPVLTGHAAGVVTLNLAEADPAAREQQRETMAEPFRTLLGHMRHELGHVLWDRLVVPDPARLDGWRWLAGDERADYGAALARHRDQGPPADWAQRHVSAYAAAHPWEDWAESCAHVQHMVDTLETAWTFGLDTRARKDGPGAASADFDPYTENDFGRILDAWVPLTLAVNSLNRSMGQQDLYPFVLAPAVVEKLTFCHRVLRRL